MKAGFVDLMNSERGVLCIALVIAVTVLVILKILTGEQWLTYTQWICTALIASKTITSTVETLKGQAVPPPSATA